MKTEVRSINPKVAEQLLAFNTSNRPLKDSSVIRYAREMSKGNWKSNGESIKISKTHKLLDGQHRLHAIVKAGVEVEMLVVSGLDDEVFNVIDTGMNRTASDVLSINGIKNPMNTAAVARFIINFNAGYYDPSNNSRQNRPTNRDIQEFVEKNYEVVEVSDVVKKDYHKFKLLPSSVVGGLYFILSKISITDTEVFFNKLITGLDSNPTCPIHVLRERLIRDTINKTRLTITEKVNLVLSAWNSYRKGKAIKSIQISENKIVAI